MIILKRITASFVACSAAMLFGATLAHALLDSPGTDLVAVNPEKNIAAIHTNAPPDYPVRLIIPSLSVDANVQYVGITKHGTMAVPTNFTDVGWYRNGPVPGMDGSAVMAGHVDNALALPGVFKYLDNIQIGADIYVRAKNGTLSHFVVDDKETYNATEAPAAKIFAKGAVPRLNLVTCQGDWIQSEHQYDHRLVVYTHLVSD